MWTLFLIIGLLCLGGLIGLVGSAFGDEEFRRKAIKVTLYFILPLILVALFSIMGVIIINKIVFTQFMFCFYFLFGILITIFATLFIIKK